MFARIGNLVLAFGFFLMVIWPNDWRWAGSPPPRLPAPMPLYGLVLTEFIHLWLIAAIILFFRSRIGWLVSLVGVGLATAFFSWILLNELGQYFLSGRDGLHRLGGVFALGFLLALLTVLVFCGGCITACIKIFIGLIKMRHNLRRI